MNWYKIAQNTPQTLGDIGESRQCWIDPNGIVYEVELSHVSWIKDNLDFINRRYSLALAPEIPRSHIYNDENLTKLGWIRLLWTSKGAHFNINSLYNTNSLRRIEEGLFQIHDPRDTRSVEIWGIQENTGSLFHWNEFVNSGNNFIDYVQAHIYQPRNNELV